MSAHPSKRRWYVLALLAALLVAIALFWNAGYQRWQLIQTRQALANGDHARALHAATRLLDANPDSIEARRAAIRSAQALELDEVTLEHLLWFDANGEATVADLAAIGEISFELGRVSEAERYLEQALAADPNSNATRSRLIQLLAIECRTYEALAHRQELLKRGVWTTEDLMYMAKPDDLMDTPDLDVFLQLNPSHPHLLLAKSRQARLQRQYQQASNWLEQALDKAPDLLEAHADRGLLLLEGASSDTAFAQWHDDLPKDADRHPNVWVVRGMWSKQRGDSAGAVRCFAEALLLDPNHRIATYQLSLLLAGLGNESLAAEFSARVSLLDELGRATDDLYDSPATLLLWVRAGDLLESLGRIRESAAWYHTLADIDSGNTKAREIAEEISAAVARDTPMVLVESQLVKQLDLSAYPLPSFASRQSTSPREHLSSASDIHFSEAAHDLGIDFRFTGADKPVIRTRHLYELFGAGIGVLDFDLDGWPDIYLAQGAQSLTGDSGEMRDQLFHNHDGEIFLPTTSQSLLGDTRFTQGVAVGDFNNDGFPDLFVANIGANRLYENNGDGTFQDVTALAGIGGNSWTSSCAIADLNGDTLPDLYEVNYLGGKEAFEVLCDGPDQTTGLSCRPRDFLSEPDRFLLNLGDGHFSDETTNAGFVASGGKGLGLVVGDFDGNGRLSVFVANDTTSNHFFENRAARGEPPRFEERAALLGLAFDQNGLTQACMGIAADDVNADGYLDLFVTNFFEESNTLYQAAGGKYFEDASRATGLYAPSLTLLGFGTQFLDADLDGDPDIVLTNGHITSESADGARFQMPGQFFENQTGTFIERQGTDVGSYFEKAVLGRALSVVDYNRDGREDFAVMHLDAPFALLRNESRDAGHFLAIRLVGVRSDRDAIGASVTVHTAGDYKRTRQVTAGDGYQSSNQQQLVFGLGDATQVLKLVVRWPSGDEQQFDNLGADQQVIIVEGNASASYVSP